MDKMIAYCGIDCSECPAWIATKRDDIDELAKVAEEWSKKFGLEMTVEGVTCDSCSSGTGRVSGYCKICEVRSCAGERGVITCAHCEDYVCETLEKCPAFEARGREALEKIRAEL